MKHSVINSGACGNAGQAPRKFLKKGFALVVTLSLMILLTVIALGLLGLSSVSLRASGQSAALQKARANAHMAMMLAIGELQTQMGPDQRISADAAILDSSTPSKMENSHWMGAWNSWYAGTKGVDPAVSDHRTIGNNVAAAAMCPTYDKNRKDHFRSWLVSLSPNDAKDITAASRLSLSAQATTSPTKDSTAVQLVGKGSLGAAATKTDFVNAQLIKLAPKAGGTVTGRYAWWVGDESQKARIMGDSYALTSTLTKADKIFRHQAPGSTGTNSVPGLDTVDKVDGPSNADQRKLTYVPSLKSLGLLKPGSKEVPSKNFHHITPYSCQVLSDVREGGLKRDLSTLLERDISTGETSAPFKLYQLGNESVPVQDLAAYYQLYRNRGTQYTSNVLQKGIQTTTPNFNPSSLFLGEYSNLYRLPVPIRIQFELSFIATPRVLTPPPVVNKDTHKLHIGIAPAVTLWNPFNVPLIMNFGDPATKSSMLRMFNVPLLLKWKKNGTLITTGVSLGEIVDDPNNAFTLFFSGRRSITFQPGEVRVFSLAPAAGLVNLKDTDTFTPALEVIPNWDANQFLKMPRSATRAQFQADQPPRVPGAPRPTESRNFDETGSDYSLTFKDGDTLAVSIEATGTSFNGFGDPAFEFFLRPSVMRKNNGVEATSRQFQMNSRKGASTPAQAAFNKQLVSKGFPGGAQLIDFGSAIPVKTLIRKSANTPAQPTAFLQFTLAANAETNSPDGTQFVSRPFLHSTALTGGAFIDSLDPKSLYLSGWSWTVKKVTSGFSALAQTGRTGQGFYGGGYTTDKGSTNVVQQEIPVVPPISIAALSHAQLGGFSIARAPLGTRPADYPTNFQDTTASGNGGLFPRTLQAIGNSYAHPFLRPNEAFGKFSREIVAGKPKSVDFADHSYLANKALWDDYFFSSITPANTAIFEGSSSAAQVAQDFFFNEKPLPNRRMVPYLNNFDKKGLSGLLATAKSAADGCFADQIASHLMVRGAFNVNSTSVEAWKTFLNSLKYKKIVYLGMSRSMTDGGLLYQDDPKDPTPGVPISFASLPDYRSYQGSVKDTSDLNSWVGWRLLTDKEIDELATAIVKQVKLRGPFLSLSEFVNRRLDSSNKDLSLKGALQAALDDPAVSINSAFRTSRPKITSSQVPGTAFPEALEGPVSYGSAAYVDQADVLRNCAELLAPRGDTFVIRTYGDALDANGNIQARAWCEAVVQRVPEYIDPADLPYLKPSDSRVSGISQSFGRKLQIVSMRYLSKDEI